MALTLTVSSQSFAQSKAKKQSATTSAEVLTNASVIDLSKAGLDKDVIISKIEASQTSFDLSTNGLIALKKEKLDNDIIKAMLNKTNAGSSEQVRPVKPQPGSHLPALEMVNQVYSYNRASNGAVPLEKSQATMKTKMKAFGYGGANVLYVIDGDVSPVRVVQADTANFIINTGGAAPDLTLYKLTTNKKTRETITQKADGMFSGNNAASSGGNTLNYNVTMLKTGIYQLTPAKKLDKGEYFFAAKPTVSASSIDVYAFGIDE